MEALFSIQGHPTTDAFEEYAFKRLSEADTEALEEHVLVCSECQASLAEVDEYILLMKHATAGYELRPELPPEPRPAPARPAAGMGALIAASLVRKGPQRSLTYAVGLIAAAAGILLVFASHPMQGPVKRAERAAVSVELLALRGAPGAVRAQAERPLDLIMDLTGLPEAKDLNRSEAEKYRVEIVNAVGELTWKGEVARSQGSLSAHLMNGLKAGQYWVRLYSRGALLREFGLRAD